MNQAGVRQRLDVVRKRGCGDVEFRAEFADAIRTDAVQRAHRARRAAVEQALEDAQAVRIAERLEHARQLRRLDSFIFRHVSKYRRGVEDCQAGHGLKLGNLSTSLSFPRKQEPSLSRISGYWIPAFAGMTCSVVP